MFAWFTQFFSSFGAIFGPRSKLSKSEPKQVSATMTSAPVLAQPTPPTKEKVERAIRMLDLAISHAKYGAPDSAAKNLSVALPSLRHHPAGQAQHLAASALVYAITGNPHTAARFIRHAKATLEQSAQTISPAVNEQVRRKCDEAMHYLPHVNQLYRQIDEALALRAEADRIPAHHAAAKKKKYAAARQLINHVYEESCKFHPLVPDVLAEKIVYAWMDILQPRTTIQSAGMTTALSE